MFKLDELGVEIAQIALPAALALTADPVASLVDTAFIGQIGQLFFFFFLIFYLLFLNFQKIVVDYGMLLGRENLFAGLLVYMH